MISVSVVVVKICPACFKRGSEFAGIHKVAIMGDGDEVILELKIQGAGYFPEGLEPVVG